MNPASDPSDLILIVPFALLVLAALRQVQLKHRTLAKRVGIAHTALPRPYDWAKHE